MAPLRPIVRPATWSLTLCRIVSHRERVVRKAELMDAIWDGRFVAETVVTSRIKQARRAVGDDGDAQQLICTVHARGYRFVAPVHSRESERNIAARAARHSDNWLRRRGSRSRGILRTHAVAARQSH
jgi:DNA-binding winged helix-turn-helix (wHTH) protein